MTEFLLPIMMVSIAVYVVAIVARGTFALFYLSEYKRKVNDIEASYDIQDDSTLQNNVLRHHLRECITEAINMDLLGLRYWSLNQRLEYVSRYVKERY